MAHITRSCRLPSASPYTSNSEYEALGFAFGPPDDRDPLLRPATLPDGWRMEQADHSMWSYVADREGYRRVEVFYKSACYDRRASMHLLSEAYQRTAAQERAWERFARDVGALGSLEERNWSQWHSRATGRQRRPDGSSFFVYGFYSQDGSDAGFCRDLGTWRRTGAYLLIALDDAGGEISRVAWEVSHSAPPPFPPRSEYEAHEAARLVAHTQLDREAIEQCPGWPVGSGLSWS